MKFLTGEWLNKRILLILGLMPYGKPTEKDAREFFEFAQKTFFKIQKTLEEKA